MKQPIFATGTITDASKTEYRVTVYGFLHYDDGNRYGPLENSTPPDAWVEPDEQRMVAVKDGLATYFQPLYQFDENAQDQMRELLRTEHEPLND